MYEVVCPRGRKAEKIGHLAERLDTLEGKTVCALWTRGFRGNEIFPLIERELAKRFPGCRFVSYGLFGDIHGGTAKTDSCSSAGKA